MSAWRLDWRTVVGAGGIVADARPRGLGRELPLGRDQLGRQRRPDTRREHRLLVRLTQQERIQQRPLTCERKRRPLMQAIYGRFRVRENMNVSVSVPSSSFASSGEQMTGKRPVRYQRKSVSIASMS